MRRLVSIEFRKMRRQRLPLLAGVLMCAVVALSSVGLFSAGVRARFDDPANLPWAGLLLNHAFMAAMTAPLFTAILASRLTDIEHSGGGWMMAAGSGIGSGSLCRAKVVALTCVVVPVVAAQTVLLFLAGRLAGIDRSLEWGHWLGYAGLLVAVEIAFCALHVCLAARVDNQLVGIGLGLLGSFLAVFCLLLPRAVSLVIPWGYFAAIAPVAQQGRTIVYATPPLAWIAGFLMACAVVFTAATRRFDRIGG